MIKIKLNPIQVSEQLDLEIKDLRNSNHVEYNKAEDLKKHVERAINQNGLRYYKDDIFKDVYNGKNVGNPIGFFHHMYQLIGNAKGVIKYRLKHSQSSLSRYENFEYENLDLLRGEILLKHNKKVYKGLCGVQRIDVLESINEMCEGVESPKVLEAGCGSGLNMYLLNTLNPKIDLHGFEYTNARIASAIVNLNYSPIRKNLFLGDVCSLNLPDNSFDVVYSNHVLEQLGQEGATKALNEMWRVCKKGVVLSEPSVHGANMYEKWRMNTLGYCKDLLTIAKDLPNSKILLHEEDKYRTYPNTSYHLVIEKV